MGAAYRDGDRTVHNGSMTTSPGPVRVCFVCTGNICRSPMAEVVLRSMAEGTPLPDGSRLADHLEVSSAGTGGWHRGEPMDRRARAALVQRGYTDHGHRARQFRSDWFETTDLVVCLDRGHRQALVALAPAAGGDTRFDDRVVLLRAYEPGMVEAGDVPDPYYGDQEEFELCLDLVERGCGGLVGVLVDRVAGDDTR
jgi:protein-tyrosine phosphatase